MIIDITFHLLDWNSNPVPSDERQTVWLDLNISNNATTSSYNASCKKWLIKCTQSVKLTLESVWPLRKHCM